MIKLFVSDIDGCLAVAYEPYALEPLTALRRHAVEAGAPGTHATLPALSICSGRSYPYVEAMTQLLRITVPVLFESGSGLFDPQAAQVRWHDDFTPELEQDLDEVRQFMLSVLEGTKLSFDYGKRTQRGLVSPDEGDIEAVMPRIEAHVREHYAGLHAFATPVSVDVVAEGLTKREGLEWLAEEAGVELSEVAFIGDTPGDLPGLEVVGVSFAPANAHEDVRAAVDHVTEGAVAEGTLEAYRWCVMHNERG